MNILALIPLLIIIIILVGFNSINKKPQAKPKYVKRRKKNLLVSGYAALLVVAFVAYHFLPLDRSDLKEMEDDSQIREMDKVYGQFYKSLHQGKINEMKDKHPYEKWEFNVDDPTIGFRSNNMEAYVNIFIEKSAELEGKMEVIYFKTPTIINGIDFTDKIKGYQMDYLDGELLVKVPHSNELKLAKFGNEFTIEQFSGGISSRFGTPEQRVMGDHLIYVKLPQDVQIMKNDGNFTIQEVKQK
ncbi:hypothetical protein GCM10008967_36000 [Bacillus carboniphilus]|uniref:Uncharacterized protein n=1 Tax=Bacillus carboniphilus TaxID=86663 RepID=A0ABN0WNC3_9BACI